MRRTTRNEATRDNKDVNDIKHLQAKMEKITTGDMKWAFPKLNFKVSDVTTNDNTEYH